MKNYTTLSQLIIIILLLSSCAQPETTSQKVDYLNESDSAFNERMEWWRDARFGMFVHWGLYAVPAGIYQGKEIKGIGEWIMNNAHIPVAEYEKYAAQFDPQEFDADRWVSIMKDAGMKYVVITSKHHDGFALWDSKVSNYDIVDSTPYGKDILKQLSEACKKHGIKFGIYYSTMDWHHPDAQAPNYPNYNHRDKEKVNPKFQSYLEDYMKPQLKEIITQYDPEIIWFDGEWIPDFTHENGMQLYQYIRELKPSIIINNRVDKGRQGMMGMNAEDENTYAGDFGTPEQEILENTATMDWESCMTMNDTWGFKSNDHHWKSGKLLIHNLIDVASKGGNYLLNVGPTALGQIPDSSITRLEQMGDWLDVNGEAIYATNKFDHHFKQGDSIRYTRKKDTPYVYGVLLKVPVQKVSFKYIKPVDGSKIFVLGYDQPLTWNFESGELNIKIPTDIPSTLVESCAWVFKIEGEEITD